MWANAPEDCDDETGAPEDAEEDLITSIIRHLFLSPQLHSAQENLPALEQLMLKLVSDSVLKISSDFPQLSELKLLARMFECWTSLQLATRSTSEFVEKFSKEITKLKVGESVACYIPNQNAGVLFTNLDNNHTVAQTYQCSFQPHLIMSNVNPLFVTYPHSTDAIVNKEVLTSKSFARHLHELSTTPAESYIPKSSDPDQNSTSLKTVQDPFLVTDWLVGLLVPVETDINRSLKFNNITKKIRDEVITHQSSPSQTQFIPFRRSAMWTSIKVSTHLKLAQMFPDVNEATGIYKVIMLHILTNICRQYESNDPVVWSLMLAKLGRRTEKLRRLQIEEDSFMKQLKEYTMASVDATVSDIKIKMDKMWEEEYSHDEHIMYPSTRMPYKFTNKTPEELLRNPPSDLLLSYELKRCSTLDSILLSTCSNHSHTTRWIQDTEVFIKNVEVSDITSSHVYDLFNKYQTISLKYYKLVQDPVGLSQVVLCTLKLVQILDIIATTKYPLLLEYASGIPQSAFDKLLLPYSEDMTLLEEILDYFLNRDTNSIYPGVLSSNEVTQQDFQVRYASTNQKMIELKQKIDADTEAAIQKKYDEVKSVAEACSSFQNEINRLTCECKYETRINVKYIISTCQKCDMEKNQLTSKKYSVCVYERPLPVESYQQWAVVYELKIPTELANLRDALAFLNHSLLVVVVPNPPTKVAWKNYPATASYDDKRKCQFYNLKSSASSAKMTYSKKKDVLRTPKEHFIMDNGMNCVYAHNCVGVNESFKFKITNTNSPDREIYMSLQYALEGTNINQNEVIADVYNCHKDISLTEFKSFGFLKDGHRIQLRNLYAYIADSSLALEKEPVIELIMQLCEIGEKENGCRINHFKFMKNDAFTQDFLRILNNVVDKNEINYGNALILLSVIVITTRILELNVEAIPEALRLLRKCRLVLDKWVTRISESIALQLNESGSVYQSLKLNLLQVSICSAFTFNISPAIDQQLEEQDLSHWLHTITRLHQLVYQDNCLTNASPFIQSLVTASFNVALKLEPKILPVLPTLLKTFAVSQWSKANQCYDDPWKKLTSTESCYFAMYVERNATGLRHVVTFDYLQGTFLVDGFPQGVIPVQIKNSSLYKSYFQNTNLKVQRDMNGFQTVAPFHSNHYEFRVDSDIVKIKEVRDTISFELVDPCLFEDKIAKSFLDNYTHWLTSDNKQVLFRRKPVTNDDYNKPAEFALVRSEDGRRSWTFENVLNNKLVLSRSSIFQSICKTLKTLEDSKSIHVMKDKTTNVITAYLPRYGLNFNLVSDHLHSVEYPGFQISEEQNLNTLVGLQQSLLLHNNSSIKKQKIIVPHGNIQVLREGSKHQVTNIDITSLYNPSYFIYDIDPVLCRLKAQDSKEAWLYLAALHGATSSPLPDLFTGLTGTEMAVWILQSALIWSSTPYDDNCLRILTTIKNFSPKRTYKGQEDIGVIIWPEGLNNLAAYDGYALIVKKLIDDSNALVSLHGGKKAELEKENVSEKLAVRAYRRNISFYNQCAGLKALYFPKGYQPNEHVMDSLNLRNDRVAFDIENLERLPHSLLETNSHNANCSLKPFLITENSLGYGDRIKSLQTVTLVDLLTFDFRANWLELYSHAISLKSKDKQERQAWNIFFAAMSYKGVDVSQLLNLHLIVKYANAVKGKFPPVPVASYPTPSDNVYSNERLESSLHKAAEKHPEFLDWVQITDSEAWRDYTNSSRKSPNFGDLVNLERKYGSVYENSKMKFGKDREEYIRTTVQSLQLDDASIDKPLSPEKIRVIKLSPFFASVQKVVDLINSELQLITQHKKLLRFVENVEAMLDKVLQDCSKRYEGQNQRKVAVRHWYKPMALITVDVTTEPYQPFEVDTEELFQTSASHMPLLQVCSQLVYNWGKIETAELFERCSNLKLFISSVFTDSVEKLILSGSGISPRVAPMILMQYVQRAENPSKFIISVGALAVLWTQLQRQTRIKALKEATDATSVEHELAGEEDNRGYANWAPKDHPEWIILQLELDMMIRPVQVEVAKQMMETPNGKNGVMQLNMGEGKTSVIIPMLCATLARCDSLVRVTVLKSIFDTNLKLLSFTVGGLLNQRVYVFPCKRDVEINKQVLEALNNNFKTCLESRSVILTLPEHRLSFRLKIYDEINKGNVKLGLKMMETEDWLREHVRDLLDESDELLSVKYQLVYTVGTQIPIDGNDLRWKTSQRLLEHVQTLAPQLSTNFGSSVIEFDNTAHTAENPEQFEHLRFLTENCKSYFYDQLADRVLEYMMLSTSDKNVVKKFLTQENPSMAIHKRVVEITKDSNDLLKQILLFAGYIGRGILYLALTKRWRVEYGVDPKGYRRMAVPFQAKDVAAEKTEFGHPDLAIVLTQLSYYYSGLSDHEMSQIFKSLKTKNSPEMIYSSWVQQVNQERLPSFLSSYQGINLNDSYHRSPLYNLFRKHKSVIDFYLSEKVFPKESKQFSGKMSMSAWDLCHEKTRLPVSGFSGTNDSSVLLPLAITQQDLAQLARTNQELEHTLLNPENRGHLGLKMGVTCEGILKKMTEDGRRVLIDAGALMLELDNEQVASLWLTIDTSLEATVYFSPKNEILVKTREAIGANSVLDTQLEFSPFQSRLGACGVFLDDQHTRATDLKFPTRTRACVTVGTRMKREKLMQACMRMRKLGNGHSVTFYLSHEVFDKIMGGSNATLQTSDIIAWVVANTRKFNDDGLVHWAMAGRNYAQKLAAEQEFEEKLKTSEAAKIMGAQVVDKEVTLLEHLYGVFAKSDLLFEVIPKLFETTKQKLELDNNGTALRYEVGNWFDSICSSVVSRCREFVPEKKHLFNTLEEEQEKELEKEKEVEVEEERQVRRPPKAEHVTPSLHPNVQTVLRNGEELNAAADGIVRICDVFSNASFCNEVQPDGWGRSVYATQDFASVIKTDRHLCTDLHLRPVEYVAVKVDPVSKTAQILVLSPFEVNELLPLFREGSMQFTLHMFSMRRTEGQDSLVNNPALQVPSRGIQVDETVPALACLHVASGSLYFGSRPEAEMYSDFLGLVPQPWSDFKLLAFEKGWITKTGFKLRQDKIQRCSTRLTSSQISMIDWDEEISSLFERDPGNLVKRILGCRHPENVNEVAHVIRLLGFLTLPFP